MPQCYRNESTRQCFCPAPPSVFPILNGSVYLRTPSLQWHRTFWKMFECYSWVNALLNSKGQKAVVAAQIWKILTYWIQLIMLWFIFCLPILWNIISKSVDSGSLEAPVSEIYLKNSKIESDGCSVMVLPRFLISSNIYVDGLVLGSNVQFWAFRPNDIVNAIIYGPTARLTWNTDGHSQIRSDFKQRSRSSTPKDLFELNCFSHGQHEFPASIYNKDNENMKTGFLRCGTAQNTYKSYKKFKIHH